jgi:hypothetical protein
MPKVEFEPTILAFEQANTVHALDRAATVTGCSSLNARQNYKQDCSYNNIFCIKRAYSAQFAYQHNITYLRSSLFDLVSTHTHMHMIRNCSRSLENIFIVITYRFRSVGFYRPHFVSVAVKDAESTPEIHCSLVESHDEAVRTDRTLF